MTFRASRWSLVLVCACLSSPAWASPALTTLVAFPTTGGVGAQPMGTLLADSAGNLYGTTYADGPNNLGTVFELSNATHVLTTLATFNGTNGSRPMGNLLADGAGNLYGTTAYGSASNNGTVFQIANDPNHTLTTLLSFGATTGATPNGSLIMDAQGNLHGTTQSGLNGLGTVFKLATDASHTYTQLASFNNSNGAHALGGVIADASGNLYGTTLGVDYQGRAEGLGYGVVYKVANNASHTLTTLATFNNLNGANPAGSLIADAAGNLYGTTMNGGLNAQDSDGYGSVFEVANDAQHTLTTLAAFNVADGLVPNAELLADAAGNLYGTTEYGGGSTGIGYGTVFKIANDANHTLTTLATFDGSNGQSPMGGLIADADGNLYGTTRTGGTDNGGTIFEITGAGFVTPEPSSVALLGTLPLVVAARRRRHASARSRT